MLHAGLAHSIVKTSINYCNSCGAKVVEKIPDCDDRARLVCESCSTVHYQNPKIVVGCLPIYQDKILLCRRAIEPRYGLWTLPAGFLELHESTADGAKRETWEEARALVTNEQLYTVFEIPFISEVYMFYRAAIKNGEFSAGIESLDVRLFEEHEIPWGELAFSVVEQTLQRYFNDLKTGNFSARSQIIDKTSSGGW